MHHMLKPSKNRYGMGDLHLPKKIEPKIDLVICNWQIKLWEDVAFPMYKKVLGKFFIREKQLARKQQLLNIHFHDQNYIDL